MGDKPWKVAERFIAVAFGVKRSAEKGRAVADVQIPGFSVESKKTKRIAAAVLGALDQAKRNVAEGTAPLVVMYQPAPGGHGSRRIVIMEFDDFVGLHRRAYGDLRPGVSGARADSLEHAGADGDAPAVHGEGGRLLDLDGPADDEIETLLRDPRTPAIAGVLGSGVHGGDGGDPVDAVVLGTGRA